MSSRGDVRWMSVLLDVPADRLTTAQAFWSAVTGSRVDDPWGDDDEFWPLRPPQGDPCLWLQRTDDGPVGCHPDLYVQDPRPVGEAGRRSIVDQVCLDIPGPRFEAEATFWAALTGWSRTTDGRVDEFERLVRPAHVPYAVLLQRLDDDQAAVTAHLDLACDDRDAETARHVSLGAEPVRRTAGWTVLRDPVGTTYCLTDRGPGDVSC
jgi:hypothetical protein